jgi:hypothetical protein
MKQILLFTFFLLCIKTVFSQAEYSSFTSTGRGGATTFATDYQAVGINPANLGWTWDFEEKKVAWGLAESSYSLHSEALTKQQLRDVMSSTIKGNGSDFTRAEKIQAARDFTETGFSFNADLGSFGIAFTGKKLGGIGFRVNDRFQWNSSFGKTAADILFLGYNADYFDKLIIRDSLGNIDTIANSETYESTSDTILSGFNSVPKLLSEVMNGSQMKMSWMREWNLSYGRKLFEVDSTFALYAGVGIKYFQGLAYLDIRSENNQLDAFSAMSPVFGIDYGSAANLNPSNVAGNGMKPVGHGFGFDFGVNAVLFNKLKLGVAVTNIGSMTWDGNVYTVKDTLLYDTQNTGLENYNIFTQLGDILGENGLFKYEGLAERTVKLPTALRLGASMKIGKILELGTDIIVPMNDEAANFNKAMIGFGGDFKPIKWLRLQAGFMSGGNYDFQIPVGITFIAKKGTYEAGFASRDAITFFSQNGPTLSLSMGFIRWRI